MKPQRTVRRAIAQAKGAYRDLILRTIFSIVSVYVVLSGIGIPWAPLSYNALALIIVGILWLFFELALDHSHARDNRQGVVLDWDEAADLLRDALKNRVEIDVVASSSVTFYYRFRERIGEISNAQIRVLLRTNANQSPRRTERLRDMKEKWNSLASEEANRTITVKYSTQGSIRAMRIKDTLALSHYAWDEASDRFVGDSVPMLISKSNYQILQFFDGLFGYLWLTATDTDPFDAADTVASETEQLMQDKESN